MDRVYRSSVVDFVECKTWIGLIILDMVVFYVIMGMDRLAPYHVVWDYFSKTVTLATLCVRRIP